MDGLVWPELENSTAGLGEGDAALNTTTATPAAWRSAGKPAKAFAVAALAIMTVGAVTNSGALVVLVRARREFASCAHTLITNQCAIDLYASALGMSTVVVRFAHGYHYNPRLPTTASVDYFTLVCGWSGSGQDHFRMTKPNTGALQSKTKTAQNGLEVCRGQDQVQDHRSRH